MTQQLEAELSGAIDYTRQRDFFDPSLYENSKVVMVGCGGIGSFSALALAKLGIQHFVLIDPDVVETHNIPNQMFTTDGVDRPKVDAIADEISFHGAPQNVITRQEMLADTPRAMFNNGVVISALDSMEARRELWEKHVKGNGQIPCFIDARLGGFNIRVFTIDPSNAADIEYYEATLYSDEEATEESCTGRAIIDVGFQVASLITRQVRKHFTEANPEREIWFHQDALDLMKG